MEKLKTIDEFKDALIINFGCGEYIINYLQFIDNMCVYGSYKIDNNSINWTDNYGNFTKYIKIDTDSKHIISASFRKNFNEHKKEISTYKEKDNNIVFNNYCKEDSVEVLENDDIKIQIEENDRYVYLNKNLNFIGGSYTTSFNETVKNSMLENTSTDKHKESTTLYVLPTGERVKIVSNDQDNKYYLYNLDGYSKEITENDVNSLLNKSNNIEELINDELIYEAKKGFR